MSENIAQKVESSLHTATDYVASANLLMEFVKGFIEQGDLASASRVLESVNLLLERANQTVQKMSELV